MGSFIAAGSIIDLPGPTIVPCSEHGAHREDHVCASACRRPWVDDPVVGRTDISVVDHSIRSGR